MRVGGARHRDSVLVVGQTISCLILNRCIGFLLFHAVLESATLNHEIVDHAMKNGVVIKTAIHIFQKILHGIRSFLGIQLQCDSAEIGVQFDHGFFALS